VSVNNVVGLLLAIFLILAILWLVGVRVSVG
jgi:hypothetical protein